MVRIKVKRLGKIQWRQNCLQSGILQFCINVNNDEVQYKVTSSGITIVACIAKFANWCRRQYGNEHKNIWMLQNYYVHT
jgi:hypothetical protein